MGVLTRGKEIIWNKQYFRKQRMPKIGVFISNVLPGIFILFIYLVNISTWKTLIDCLLHLSLPPAPPPPTGDQIYTSGHVPWPRIEPATLWCRWRHSNHYLFCATFLEEQENMYAANRSMGRVIMLKKKWGQ